MASTGHCHPKVVKAIQDQTQEFIIAQQNIFTASPAMVSHSVFHLLPLLYADASMQSTLPACNRIATKPLYLQVGLLDRLARIVPKGLDTHIFANSGSEVVENAIKMARAHTKKTNIICFDVRFLLSVT